MNTILFYQQIHRYVFVTVFPYSIVIKLPAYSFELHRTSYNASFSSYVYKPKPLFL